VRQVIVCTKSTIVVNTGRSVRFVAVKCNDFIVSVRTWDADAEIFEVRPPETLLFWHDLEGLQSYPPL